MKMLRWGWIRHVQMPVPPVPTSVLLSLPFCLSAKTFWKFVWWMINQSEGSLLSCRVPDSESECHRFDPQQERWENCFPQSKHSALILISVFIPPQYNIKDPSHSAKSAGGRLWWNTCTPMTHWSRKGLLCCPDTVWELIRETDSHTTYQGTLVHSHLSLLSHCGLTPGLKVELVCEQIST